MTSIQKEFYSATVNKSIADLLGRSETEDAEDNVLLDKSKRTASRFDYKLILDLEENEGQASEDNYYEALQRLEEERNQRSRATSAYNAVPVSSEVRVSIKHRFMDLRKCTNHPYLIEYPLTDDGVYYRHVLHLTSSLYQWLQTVNKQLSFLINFNNIFLQVAQFEFLRLPK